MLEWNCVCRCHILLEDEGAVDGGTNSNAARDVAESTAIKRSISSLQKLRDACLPHISTANT